jgi:hypothetical protein
LRALYPDQDLLYDVENKINEVIDRYHYSNLDFNKIPSTFINSVFKLGEHIASGSWRENCVRDAGDYEMKRKEHIANLAESLSRKLKMDGHSNEKFDSS